MYKLMPRNLARATSPVVSVTRLGRITLNAAAARIMVEKKVENVFLLWDCEARKFALQPSPKGDASGYELRFGPDKAGAGFSAKPFLRQIGFEFEETLPLKTEWSESGQMLEVTLPTEAFNKKHRFPRLRRSRRSTNAEASAEKLSMAAVVGGEKNGPAKHGD